MTRFSVIVPVFNVAPYLKECIDSVASNARKDFEIELILVNDGSTDASAEIISNVCSNAFVLKTYSQKNQGVSVARNAALGMATGDWLVFLDGDDVLRNDVLESAYRLITEVKFDILFYQTYRFQDGEALDWPNLSGSTELIDVRNVFPVLKSSSFGGGQMYRTALVKDLRMGPFEYGEDMVFLAMSLARASHICLLHKACYGYRMRMSSAMHKPRSLKYMMDLIETRMLVVLECAKCEKIFDSFTAKWIAGELTEEFNGLLGCLSKEDSKIALARYSCVLNMLMKYSVGFGALDKLRLWALRLNSSFFPRFICATIPRFLKLLKYKIRKCL